MNKRTAFEGAIRKIWEIYSTYMISGDMDRWIELWDDNAVQMPPDTPMRRGRTAVYEAMTKGLQGVNYNAFAVELGEAAADEQFGFARGTFTYAFTRKAGGGEDHREGKYLTIFRRQPDGSWKIYCDCFNFDASAR